MWRVRLYSYPIVGYATDTGAWDPPHRDTQGRHTDRTSELSAWAGRKGKHLPMSDHPPLVKGCSVGC